MNCSLPGSSLHGIFLAEIPEWVAMLSSKGSSQLRDRTHDSSFTWTADRFFTHWVIGEAHSIIYVYSILLWNHEYFFDTLNHNPVLFHLFADQIILTLVIRSSFKLTHESLWHASYFVFTSLTFGSQGFPGSSDGKSVCQQCGRPGFDPWVRKIPWRRQWQPTPVFLPGKFHGRRSLVGYSPQSHKESDTTEQLHFQFNFKFWYTSRYTLHIIWFRSRVNHFSQVPWFLSLKNNIKNQD